MELIKPSDLYFGRKGWFARLQACLLIKIARLDVINKLYEDTCSRPGPFAEELLGQMNVNYVADSKDVDNIPSSGASIVIANHPTGGVEGVMLVDLLSRHHCNVKFMGNFLLSRIEPLKPFCIDVNPFDAASEGNLSGIREALRHLASGGMLVIFPAGAVSTWQRGFTQIKDRPWPNSIMKFIRRAQVPVTPIYIQASSSLWLHLGGKIHPLIRTLLLPRELLRQRGRTLRLRIGSAILPKKTEDLSDAAYCQFLRANVDLMNPGITKPHRYRIIRKSTSKEADEIHNDVRAELLSAEIEKIRPSYRLFISGGLEVYCAPADQIPYMMQAIGTMREITFREIGEGTNRATDTDRFDGHYHHLFVWDTDACRLVGAYRMGFGDQIMTQYGLSGFYTSTLFRMEPQMGEVMRQTIELGRSFVARDYQRKPGSLMLLWKGILHVLLKHEQFRYLMGPVTISGSFQNVSKLLIAKHINHFHLDTQKAAWIKPRTGIDIKAQIDDSAIDQISSLDLINKIVCDIEQNAFTVPILIRKYLQLNSNVLAFNTDHDFCDSLDALMLLDLRRVPEETILMLSKELKDIDVLARFKHLKE